MGRIFDMDSPVMNFLSKMADLIYLNFLTLICCLPIVTIGASMTALHYVLLKMVRNEEGYLTRSFFKSFKQNFRQATIIWLIMILVMAALIGDMLICIYSGIAFPAWIRIALVAVLAIFIFATMHIFPVLSRFENTVKNTFKNSLFMGILTLPKTILMIICSVIPTVLLLLAPQMFPFVLMFGISGPALVCALLYNKTFKRFEPESETAGDEEWTVAPEGEEPEKSPGDEAVEGENTCE